MIVLKRLILLALLLSFSVPVAACSGSKGDNFVFNKYGIYEVTELSTGVSFTARFSKDSRELCFHAPDAIKGLTAIGTDAGSFTLDYCGGTVSVGSFAIKTASDFFAALELLDQAGKVQNEAFSANVDGIQALATINNGKITELNYCDGLNNRNYKITTEAMEWTVEQKQGST